MSLQTPRTSRIPSDPQDRVASPHIRRTKPYPLRSPGQTCPHSGELQSFTPGTRQPHGALPGCPHCHWPPGRLCYPDPHRWSSRPGPPADKAPCACVPHPPRVVASAGTGLGAPGAAAADCSCPPASGPGPRPAAHGLPTAPRVNRAQERDTGQAE